MPDLPPNDEEEFLERLRSLWNESVEFGDPPPEALEKAKAAFRQHAEQKRRRAWLILAAVVFLVAATALLFFLQIGFP